VKDGQCRRYSSFRKGFTGIFTGVAGFLGAFPHRAAQSAPFDPSEMIKAQRKKGSSIFNWSPVFLALFPQIEIWVSDLRQVKN